MTLTKLLIGQALIVFAGLWAVRERRDHGGETAAETLQPLPTCYGDAPRDRYSCKNWRTLLPRSMNCRKDCWLISGHPRATLCEEKVRTLMTSLSPMRYMLAAAGDLASKSNQCGAMPPSAGQHCHAQIGNVGRCAAKSTA